MNVISDVLSRYGSYVVYADLNTFDLDSPVGFSRPDGRIISATL